ncbi:MAG: hypothetical protein JW965_06480 [Bacteroidales bacterium]|nr:hypothetical protein [Bacteroidales bacterium]
METPEEIKKRTLELAKKGGFIEGIYNYCDRWCEKCAFKSKCFSYASSPDYENMSDEDTVEYITNNLKATMLMLDEIAEEMGIDISEIPDDETDFDRHKPFHDPLTAYAREASNETHDWLESVEPGTGIKKINSLKSYPGEKKEYHDALEVICYYLIFISVKLERALMSVAGADDNEYMKDDSDGSAKVALIAIDRSIAAWGIIMKERPEYEDAILQFLIKLSKIRSETEKRFPDARSFIRPGLDD